MVFKPLTIEDRPVFRSQEILSPLETSDVNFTNLFIWRSYYNFIWTEAAGCLCLIAEPENQPPFALPPQGRGDHGPALDFLGQALRDRGAPPVIRKAPQSLVDEIRAKNAPVGIEEDPDNDDYVYLTESLITLGGRRMHQKKNHYNFFKNNYRFECLELTPELAPALVAVEDGWLSAKSAGDELQEGSEAHGHLRYERESVREVLRYLKELELAGIAIKIDGVLEAFTIGEPLSPDTALIHVEKANPAIRGLYVALVHNFCQTYFSEYKYVNREQDLGLPGLRRSKESLKPDHMRKKYTLTLACN